jgi:hypothetical protein
MDQEAQNKIAYLSMLQAVITRMESNSASTKNYAIAILSALLALFAANKDKTFLTVAIVPSVIFMILDAKYLRLERAFRARFDSVRKEPITQGNDFSMSPSFIAGESTLSVMFTWSVAWFYVPIILGLFLFSLLS